MRGRPCTRDIGLCSQDLVSGLQRLARHLAASQITEAMLKFLLERILPRERLIKLDLPRMEFADDAVEALGKVMSDVAEGRMTPSEGAAVAPLINSCARAIDMADLVKRMDALEAQIKGGRAP